MKNQNEKTEREEARYKATKARVFRELERARASGDRLRKPKPKTKRKEANELKSKSKIPKPQAGDTLLKTPDGGVLIIRPLLPKAQAAGRTKEQNEKTDLEREAQRLADRIEETKRNEKSSLERLRKVVARLEEAEIAMAASSRAANRANADYEQRQTETEQARYEADPKAYCAAYQAQRKRLGLGKVERPGESPQEAAKREAQEIADRGSLLENATERRAELEEIAINLTGDASEQISYQRKARADRLACREARANYEAFSSFHKRNASGAYAYVGDLRPQEMDNQLSEAKGQEPAGTSKP